MTPAHCDRRTLLAAAGAAGLTAALTSCGEESPGGTDAGTPPATSGSGEAGGAELAKTGDIPQGGGVVFQEQKVVVTQPSAGEFRAFSATCTHEGCLVAEVTDGSITCPCHGSAFAVADGSVTAGPAQRPLPPAGITVSGDSIRLE
ncbi:Rieske (2Fe-2S) protein [Streptomyces sp. JJ66]|uniref:Rieske (2Fe-2S) protein n=1 Tax=Streptomyces sp. JJ66 TaxID=2803843 RepID=UPI001C594B24|nr:Rieske (2Fe-2S) protein [Streptomyces sp. JJ66]MBW1603283.1 Rieske (2Fe-2S) protein [Streptomyces sp. JJ66]